MEDIFSIGEVSKLLDVPAATIRFWEQEGLLSPRKEANRYRAYGPRELAEITGTAYSRIKISFDVICLLTTAVLTFFGLGRIMGLGVGHGAGGLHHGQVHRTHRRVDGPQGELCLYPEPPSAAAAEEG